MSTIRFVLRTDKPDKDGLSPIQLVFQVKGQRKYFNTEEKILPENWNLKTQAPEWAEKKRSKKNEVEVQNALNKVKNIKLVSPREGANFDKLLSAKEVEELKGRLSAIKSKIFDIENRFELDGIIYSADMVISKLKDTQKQKTKVEAHSKVLFDFMNKYINDHSSTRVKGSLSVYRSVMRQLSEYQKATGSKVTFDSIDHNFFQLFQNYLLKVKKVEDGKSIPRFNNTTIAKQLSTLKTFLNYARVQGIEVSDKYKNFKIKRETLEVIALTNDEFETLFYFDLSGNKRLSQARDIFCFACATGLRYSDLEQLKREHIKEDGIRLTVKKTRELLMVPLNPAARAILSKYASMPEPLPMISNQKLNIYIKELCKLAGINEPVEIVRFRGVKREPVTYPKFELIGVHTGRKTFVTLMLEKGASAEAVMSMTGHVDYKSFKRYVKITETHKNVVMAKTWKMPKKNVLNRSHLN